MQSRLTQQDRRFIAVKHRRSEWMASDQLAIIMRSGDYVTKLQGPTALQVVLGPDENGKERERKPSLLPVPILIILSLRLESDPYFIGASTTVYITFLTQNDAICILNIV